MAVHTESIQLIAPALLVYAHDRERASQQGSVLFYHGLGSSKDQQLTELTSLAERGFLAIGVDNVGHGERRYADFDARFSQHNPNWGHALLGAVAATAQEVPRLLDAYIQAGIVNPARVGLVGVSMGGYIAYAAALAERRLKAVSVILGSPVWWEAEANSPHRTPERFYPTALLSQNAGCDTSVPPHHARDFHQTLTPYYADQPARQQYLEYPQSGHFMREQDWHQCWEHSLNWLNRWL
ncbi:MAG: hypothetical protein CVV27_08995 [Candidatus Melainabacteria bacterium HGW-Melainabacteria-1]|nr:MAG: hypothetical protein CVV27_08995 [Candidatus Melainabacteria bacterium HGW-Melainabacteria-1]